MAHLHSEPGQHDHTVTAYIVRRDGGTVRTLLHFHQKLQRLLPVGGHIELDETPWEALLHEVLEETGYEASQLTVLQPPLRIRPSELSGVVVHPQPFLMNTHPIPTDHFHSDISYLLEVADEPRQPLAPGESHDLRWLTAEEVAALPSELIWPGTRVAAQAALGAFLEQWQPVPSSEFQGREGVVHAD